LRRAFLLGALLAPAAVWAQNPTVRVATTLGDIDIQLLQNVAPRTVANFLNYVNKKAYDNSFFHRSVAGFVVQGGGFRWQGGVQQIPEDPPVRNEFGTSNTRGTVAMAKLGSGPDTATNQWFFNLGDNSGNLNNQNGGFTVFGRVANEAGLAIMDRIAAVPTYNQGGAFDTIPLINFTGGGIQEGNLVRITTVTLTDAPVLNVSGVVTATAFGGFSYAAPGSFIEIYGSGLGGGVSRGWELSDFVNNRAPTTLEGVTVTIGGMPAFVNFVSPTQVNAQVPAVVSVGDPLSVIVGRGGGTSPVVRIDMRRLAPGLLAPAAFKPGERQYVVALHQDGTFVSNGTIAGVGNAPARAGETLVFFGTGFGPVTTATSIAGTIVPQPAPVDNPVDIRIGGMTARVLFAGLAQGLVGVYQFNVAVPAGLPAGDARLEITAGIDRGEQELWIPIASN